MVSDVVYIDIMDGAKFLAQVPYIAPPNSDWDAKHVEEYVYQKHPSFRYRNIHIEFSENKRS
jgi:hypothetical protein